MTAAPAVSERSAVEHLFDPTLRQALIELRRAIHADPELSFQEERTAQKLERALTSIAGASVQRVANTGVVARVRGIDRSAPLVAIRGDIDALPVREETGLPFASHNEGVMHACGHDVHATWAVGAAALLAERPASGDVLVVLQPAEETGRGAPAIIESGVLDDVRAIFGGHVDRRFAGHSPRRPTCSRSSSLGRELMPRGLMSRQTRSSGSVRSSARFRRSCPDA
jgi:hippurate hydrolase